MKAFNFLKKRIALLLALCFTISVSANSTDKKVKIESSKLSLIQLFQQIEKQTDYTIAYSPSVIDANKQVTLKKGERVVSEILSEVLKEMNVSYKIEGNHIVISKLLTDNIPTKRISGVIVDDSTGEPLIGVSVMIKGSSTGVISDVDGKFSLEVPSDSKQLRISYVGYTPVDVDVNQSQPINIRLKEDINRLEEVIVIGYGTIKKKEMTSAISHIDSKDFLNPSSLDASMLIQGKVSGLTVSNTALGDPSRQATLQIRGIASREKISSPLIVIDGIPGGDLTNINPEDIESFDVLKDGAASAIYGTRGGHGVIIVTTKKGASDGTVQTSYNASLTINQPKKELEVLTPIQFRAFRSYNNSILDKGGNTDWLDEITRTGITHKHTVSFSGGNKNSNYRVSADYRRAEGIDLRSFREEYGGRASLNHKTASGLFEFSANVAPRIIYRDKSDWGTFTSALGANPTLNVFDEATGRYTDFYGQSSGNNPVETLMLDESGTDIKLLNLDGTAKLNILPLFGGSKLSNYGLSTQITFSQYHVDKEDHWFRPSTSNAAIHNGYRGEASMTADRSATTNLEWLVNFMANINDHTIKFVGGYSYLYNRYSKLTGSNKDFGSDELKWNDLGSGEYLQAATGRTGVGSFKEDHKLIGMFGRINYDYQQKYLMSASFRYEGSSRFGKNKKWGSFPAVSVGWRISEESFMKNVSWIDELKIRADYGVTGNSNIGNYLSLATYKSFGQYFYDGEWFNVWGPGKNVNYDIHWEEGRNKNVGIDFGLFNNLISGSINYYHRNQKDLLGSVDVPVPPYLHTSTVVNVGTLVNNGIEIDLTFNIINTKDLQYSTTILGATNNNKFTSFSNDVYTGKDYFIPFNMPNPGNPGELQRVILGERIGSYFTYKYAGVDDQGDWLVWNADNTEKIPVAQATDADKRVTGNGLPKFTGSWSHSLYYKNWDMNVLFRGAFGFDIFNVHDFYWGLHSAEGNVLKSAYAENAHITSGKNVVTDYFLEKGDYFKLESVTLGYTFPFNNKFINRLRLFATGTNLFTWTKFSGVDPSTYEVNGLTPGTFKDSRDYYPSVFQFTFGLQVGF